MLDLLRRHPQRFRFDAVIRVLTRAAGCADPGEAARFRTLPGLAFPPADVTAVGAGTDGRPPDVTVGLMGLTGAAGVMPRFYTEVLLATLRARSHALHDFLDMLGHRMVALYGRAGTKYRLHRAADAAGLEPAAPDQVSSALLALTGHGTPHLAERMLAGSTPLLHYAGLFAMRPRSADRLAALVSDWLGRAVEVQQFAGAWLPIPPPERTALAVGHCPGAWNRLGVDACVGVRAWDVQARVVLRIGPLDRIRFERLLPNQRDLAVLVSLVRAFLGAETGFAINPVLAAAEVPGARLDAAAAPALLGWNTWLPTSAPRERAGSEPLFAAEVVEAFAAASGQATPGPGRAA